MKKMLLLITMGFMAISLTTYAQPQMPTPEERAEKETESMKTELNLTSEQLPKVKQINLKYAKKMDEMFKQRREPGGDFTEHEKKMNEIETQKRSELEAVLTEEQLKKYDEMVADRKKRRPAPPR